MDLSVSADADVICAQASSHGMTPLIAAIRNDRTRDVQKLLGRADIDVNKPVDDTRDQPHITSIIS